MESFHDRASSMMQLDTSVSSIHQRLSLPVATQHSPQPGVAQAHWCHDYFVHEPSDRRFAIN